MERQEFLKTLGISFAAVCVGSCISACKKDAVPPAPTPPAGTVLSANLSDLSTIGTKVIVSGVAFFRIAEGNMASSFIATQSLCTHQNGDLNWIQSSNLIQCNAHLAQFNASGVNTRAPQGGGSARNLKTFVVTVNATTVTATV